MGMGFVEDAYNALSPSALSSWPATLPQESVHATVSGAPNKKDHSGGGGGAEQVSVDCKSWILGLFSRSTGASNRAGYRRPNKMLRMFRRFKAEVRKRRGCCCRGVCVDKPALHYYKTESYERNFDRGKEYWADLPFLDITPLRSPLNQGSNVGSSPVDFHQRELVWHQQRRNGLMETVPE